MAGSIILKNKSIEISDGIHTFQFPLESMRQFRKVGLKDLVSTESGAERCFNIENSNVSGYFFKPDDRNKMTIEFYFGTTVDLMIQVQISMDQLTPLLFSIPPK